MLDEGVKLTFLHLVLPFYHPCYLHYVPPLWGDWISLKFWGDENFLQLKISCSWKCANWKQKSTAGAAANLELDYIMISAWDLGDTGKFVQVFIFLQSKENLDTIFRLGLIIAGNHIQLGNFLCKLGLFIKSFECKKTSLVQVELGRFSCIQKWDVAWLEYSLKGRFISRYNIEPFSRTPVLSQF